MGSHNKNLDDEYILVDIAPTFLSDECLTPFTKPRITQTTLGVQLIRADGKNDFINQKVEVHPRILDKWADKNRGFWVERYGKNDFYLHDLFRKNNHPTMSFSPKNVPFKRLLPRPYSCEIDCVNAQRLSGMQKILDKYKPRESELSNTSKEIKKETICEFSPPFWWEFDKKNEQKKDLLKKEVPRVNEEQIFQELRWRPIPDIYAAKNRTTCQRRAEMIVVGQPFKHEAITFYNENFPAAKLTIFPFRFAK